MGDIISFTLFAAFFFLAIIADVARQELLENNLPVPPKKNPVEEELMDGVITPVEALTLTDEQREYLREIIKNTSCSLRRDINQTDREHSYHYPISDKFPFESVEEVKRLYTKAGWIVTDGGFANDITKPILKFRIPKETVPPAQLKHQTRVRIEPQEVPEKEPALELDPLELQFKELENKEKLKLKGKKVSK